MTRHTVGSFGFEVLRHETVQDGDNIKERFLVALYRNSQPFPWHPNDSHDGPTANQEWFEWIGKASIDVYDEDGNRVGTKRGADYRTRFWPQLLYWADKAVASQARSKRIGELADSEITRTRMTQEPVDLKSRTLNEAAQELTR